MQNPHHLDIRDYSLNDIFALFKIPSKTKITVDHIKQAKKITLQMHPDKSRLPDSYFLFYKKAFEIIAAYYETQNKTSQVVPTEHEIKYEHLAEDINEKEIAKQIQKRTAEKNFHKTFNDLFEENMREKIDPTKNDWFTKEEALFQDIGAVKNVSQMNASLEKIKEKTNAMAVYRGVQMLNSGRNGTNLYGDEDEYISTDPFSKLKYEDLRKVHKDQTVFSISEKDVSKMKTYDSVDNYRKTREQGYAPLEKVEAENILRNREKEMQEKIMQKQYQSDLQTLENIEKNKKIHATFLRIGR
jgi:hypothetical protein